MCGHHEWFKDFKPFEEPLQVKFGDGSTLDTLGEGTVSVISQVNDDEIELDLKNVW